MPHDITIKAYKFSELSDKAKETARDWYREIDYGQSDILEEQFLTDLSEWIGLCPWDGRANNGKRTGGLSVYFSLGHCQGDGVAFSGPIDFPYLLEKQSALESQIIGLREQGNDYADKAVKVLLDADTRRTIMRLIDEGIDFSGKVTHEGRYYHWNSMSVELNVSSYGDAENDETSTRRDAIDADVNAVESAIGEWAKSVSRFLEQQGYDEIEYRQSPECIDESIIANGYLFTEDGKRTARLN